MQNGISKVVFGAKQLVREKFLESYCTAFMLLNKLTEVDLYKFLAQIYWVCQGCNVMYKGRLCSKQIAA